jgi:hypothetical protein
MEPGNLERKWSDDHATPPYSLTTATDAAPEEETS